MDLDENIQVYSVSEYGVVSTQSHQKNRKSFDIEN